MSPPRTRYAPLGDTAIAYQVVGAGPIDLLYAPIQLSHLEVQWEDRRPAAFYERLASFSRLIMFDKRGTGLSDPLPRSGVSTLEERMDEVQAVMDAAGSARAAFFGVGDGGPLSMLMAATFPDRVSHLILFHTAGRLVQSDDWPWGFDPETAFAPADNLSDFGSTDDPMIDALAPSDAADPRFREWFARHVRSAASPGMFRALVKVALETDIRPVLETITVPTLVMHRSGNRVMQAGGSRLLAEQIPGARYVELDGDDHYPWGGDVDVVVEEVQEFVTGTRPAPRVDRLLATVLVTDIVGSTSQAAALGDRRWRELIEDHDSAVRAELDRYRGREIKQRGDGFLATFDGPARAIECAWGIRDSVTRMGLEIRAGLHTGECELLGGDIAGIAVNIACRVEPLATPGEVLVTGTVRDLVAGSGIRFVDRGLHELKGIPEPRQLYAAER